MSTTDSPVSELPPVVRVPASEAVRVPVRRVFGNAVAYRIQWRHFLYFYLLPNVTALVLLPVFGWPTPLECGLFLAGWFATCLGVSVGFHRLFTHKAFKTYAWVETLLAVLGMGAAGGSLISWVGIHRRHHERSDVAGDPHSPLGSPPADRTTWSAWLMGMLHAHAGWMKRHEYPNPHFYTRDLYRKSWLVAVNRRYHWWVLLGIVLPGVVNGLAEGSGLAALRGMYFGGLLRVVLVHHAISSVNSVCHGIGRRRYVTSDLSTNCWWLAIPTVGESWHNNHHHRQASAYFGHVWWEVDLGAYLIRLMQLCGLAWDLHGPDDFGHERTKAVAAAELEATHAPV